MKDKFIEIYNKHIHRDGSDKLLYWLQKSDFFTAPASTRYHLNVEGGLVTHSVHVYERLRELCISEFERQNGGQPVELTEGQEESIAIIGLLHDLCKSKFYAVEMRNRKNEDGKWEQYPFYVVDDQIPYGHGEKSAFLVSWYMHLSVQESFAIRWHMGFSDDTFKGGSGTVSNAFGKFPLCVLTHIADLSATYLDESDTEFTIEPYTAPKKPDLYVLVRTHERDISTSQHKSLEEARMVMFNELADACGEEGIEVASIEDIETEQSGDVGFLDMSAYVTGSSNYDWKICKLEAA